MVALVASIALFKLSILPLIASNLAWASLTAWLALALALSLAVCNAACLVANTWFNCAKPSLAWANWASSWAWVSLAFFKFWLAWANLLCSAFRLSFAWLRLLIASWTCPSLLMLANWLFFQSLIVSKVFFALLYSACWSAFNWLKSNWTLAFCACKFWSWVCKFWSLDCWLAKVFCRLLIWLFKSLILALLSTVCASPVIGPIAWYWAMRSIMFGVLSGLLKS